MSLVVDDPQLPLESADEPSSGTASLVFCQLVDPNGNTIGPVTRLHTRSSHDDLRLLYEAICDQASTDVCFYVNDSLIIGQLVDVLDEQTHEQLVKIRVEPLKQVERSDAVCRCCSTLSGHEECILVVRFNHNSSRLATGGGDGDVRVWDMTCDTPLQTFKGGGGWITCLCWDDDGTHIASGCRQGVVAEWSLQTGKPLKMEKHAPNWISCVVYGPDNCRLLASASKDRTVRIWENGVNRMTLSAHQAAVTAIVWLSRYRLASASQDRTVKLWDLKTGLPIGQIQHSHWVNCLSNHRSMVASGSDDFTIGLWDTSKDQNKMKRLTGHCQPVIDVRFSPDGTHLVSGSFDKSVKLWTRAGEFVCNFLGHVGRVYQLAWSPDSRYVVSASADSTVKLWSLKSRRLRVDLPGHADEVYALDWSKDGRAVATGGKDRKLKLWRR